MQALHRALAALLGAGLDRDQICLLASKPTMARVLSQAPLIDHWSTDDGNAFPALSEVHDQDGQSIVATSAPILHVLLKAEAAGSQQARPFHCPQRPQLDIRKQLAGGHVALIAQTIEATQHQTVMRELLATSGTGGPFLSE